MTKILDIFEKFATDETAEVNGATVEFGGTKFIIARAGNPKYSKLLTQLVDKNRAALDLKDDSADALSDRILVEVLATTVLLGWDNLNYQGKPMAYSIENASKILSHKDFRREVVRMSEDLDHFRAKYEAEQEKN